MLVVDDDPFTASLLADALRSLGWPVVGPANDAVSALALIDDGGARPAAALLDLDLGDGPDGIDLAIALRERLPSVYALLGEGESWTVEAEAELLRRLL